MFTMFINTTGTTTTTSTSSSTSTTTEAQDWEVLRTSFIVYLPSFVGILLLFCYLRLKFPVVYNVRNTVKSLHNPHAATSHGYWSWIWNMMQINESEILQTCGMDAACLLRITRVGSYLSLIAVFCSIFLVPVYELKSGTTGTDSTGNTDGFTSTTSTSLPNGSSSFTATVVAAYIIFGSTMLFILRDFQWFIVRRETFLSTPLARNYTIYVSGIPPQYRSDAGLAQFFRRVIAHDVVHSAAVAMHVPKLSAAMDRHGRLVNTIERMKTIRDLNMQGREPMHFVLGPNRGEILERVPAIPYYTEQLDRVRSEIDELQLLISTRKDTIHLEQNRSFTATGTPNFLEGSTQGQSNVNCQSSDDIFVSATSMASGAFIDPNDVSLHRDNPSSFPTFKVTTRDSEIAEIDGDSTIIAAGCTNESQQTDVLHSDNNSSVVDENLDFPPETNAVTGKNEQYNGKEVVTILDAGFVTFRKLSAVAVALQAVHSTIPSQMVVLEAPSPDQILWNNIGLSQRVLQLRRCVAVAMTTLLCVFWTVPVTFLVSLTEIQALKEKLPFLEDWLAAAPWLEPLLNQISPLLLSFLNSVVVPILLRLLSTVEGVIGISHQEASLFSKLATFHLVQTFGIASLAGGVTSALSEVDNVSDVFRYLAKTLPPQSVYFMQLILIQTVIGLGSELLRTTALIQALLRSRVGPRVTETDRHQVFLGLRPLSNPRYFLHAQMLAGTSLRYMVLFSFSVLSPFVAYISLFSFVSLEIGFRHQFIYVYPPTLDSGGKLWIQFIIITIVCMVVAEMMLITFMALSEAPAQAYAMIPLFVSSVLFFGYLRQRHFKVANYLSLETCDSVDNVTFYSKSSGDTMEFLNNKYKQPELLALKKRSEENFDSTSKSDI